MKIFIIGGGAAGFFAALEAKKKNPKAEVVLLEKTAQLLSKVKISGGGRCNVTHACFNPKELTQNYPRGSRELLGLFSKFQPRDTIHWFKERGVILKKEEDGIAAIGTGTAANIYGLKIIESDIEDNKDNKTRFVFVGNSIQPKTGSDKTSIVCFLKQDRPGSLFNILKEFADRDINLTRLESRPAKKDLGDYVFSIDLDGHLHDKEVYAAIDVLRKTVYLVKILGSYPKWK